MTTKNIIYFVNRAANTSPFRSTSSLKTARVLGEVLGEGAFIVDLFGNRLHVYRDEQWVKVAR